MKIFLNPGHAPNGEPDTGACGNGLKEAIVVADIAADLEKYLVKAGVEIVGNVQDDNLNYVVNEANRSKADFFISIHCNSYVDPAANGTEVYAFSPYTIGTLLADSILDEIVGSFDLNNRGVKYANFFVLRATIMPAVLVETAFVSNPHDADILRGHTTEIAAAIARGVTNYQLHP